MPAIAYLANLYPAPSEPYVREEIAELRRRGARIIPCSIARNSHALEDELRTCSAETLYVRPLKLGLIIQATWLVSRNLLRLQHILIRILLRGEEPFLKRVKALAHTWLGSYLALLLANKRVDHIHVHHGYFGSWVAMVAARVLGITFSMTLHGSDLLLHPSYLDLKLKECSLCFTISDFDRRHLLKNHPEVDPCKIIVHRMGVECCDPRVRQREQIDSPLAILSVGRLHPVKDHKFLLLACRLLKHNGLSFVCRIAGEGDERPILERMIVRLGLAREVELLGHIAHDELAGYYDAADMVVLTSRSEGVPLVLMEAMARGALVLAPGITGIPELVLHDETGFLYQPGSLEDFVLQVEQIHRVNFALDRIRHAARQRVLTRFNRDINLGAFCDSLLLHLGASHDRHPEFPAFLGVKPDEDPVLQ